jgi:hypothetical protein
VKPKLTVDLDEGRIVELGCCGCRETAGAVYVIARPFHMYLAALDCPVCGTQLVQFDAFTMEVR